MVFPSRAEYVRRAVVSMVQLLPDLTALDDAGQADLARDLEEAELRAFAWGDGLAAPMTVSLVVSHG